MNSLNSYNFTTSPLSQPARKLRRPESPTLRFQRLSEVNNRRNLIKKYSGMSEVKELDAETGLYYYGARYLDPRTSRWLSGDPAMGEYVPVAPINDDARKHNSNLPGLGGVFNYVNLHVYHYAGNNPVKLIDPDGRQFFNYLYRLTTSHSTFIGEPVKGIYPVVTIVNTLFGSETFIYNIDNGVIRFDFSINENYFNTFLQGGGEELAKAMYEAAKKINPDNMSGRTIGGINVEFQLHYIAYKTLENLGMEECSYFINAKVADMGGAIRNKPGFDDNAWVFQAIQAGRISIRALANYPSNVPWATISAIEEIMGYIR